MDLRSYAQATSRAAAKVCSHVGDRWYGQRLAGDPGKRLAGDPAENVKTVKAASRRLGADVVGICAVDAAWLAERPARGELGPDAEDLGWAVVLGFAMDIGRIRQSDEEASAESRIGYMRMAVTAAAVAEFLTEMGHAAMPLGNQRVASVPLAIRAGLGARGRNGLLLHPDHGPCLRLAKVLTDLPLASDAAGSTELAAVCLSCDACVVGCPAGAIAAGRDTQGASSACPDYWRQGHRGCARCIAACPASG